MTVLDFIDVSIEPQTLRSTCLTHAFQDFRNGLRALKGSLRSPGFLSCRFSVGLVVNRASGGGGSAGEAEKGEDGEACVASYHKSWRMKFYWHIRLKLEQYYRKECCEYVLVHLSECTARSSRLTFSGSNVANAATFAFNQGP